MLSSLPRRQMAWEFIGHPHLAEPGCWGVVQQRDHTVNPGSHQEPDPFGSPLLLSAGDRGNIHNTLSAYPWNALKSKWKTLCQTLKSNKKKKTIKNLKSAFLFLPPQSNLAQIPSIQPSTSMGNYYLPLIASLTDFLIWLSLRPVCYVPSLSSLSKQSEMWRTTTAGLSTLSHWG